MMTHRLHRALGILNQAKTEYKLMPKRTTSFQENRLYHAYNRAFKMEPIFRDKFFKARFLEKSFEYARRFGVSIEANAVLENHFHFLLRGGPEIQEFLTRVQLSYANYYNNRKKRKGPVFWGRYGARRIKNKKEFEIIIEYILKNPIEFFTSN